MTALEDAVRAAERQMKRAAPDTRAGGGDEKRQKGSVELAKHLW